MWTGDVLCIYDAKCGVGVEAYPGCRTTDWANKSHLILFLPYVVGNSVMNAALRWTVIMSLFRFVLKAFLAE